MWPNPKQFFADLVTFTEEISIDTWITHAAWHTAVTYTHILAFINYTKSEVFFFRFLQ